MRSRYRSRGRWSVLLDLFPGSRTGSTASVPGLSRGSHCWARPRVHFDEVDAEDYLNAPGHWHQQTGWQELDVLGVGGKPAWLQNDESPDCSGCNRPMTFVVQLEEGHDHRTSANFGGGSGYGFRCGPRRTAAFLRQR